jgi:DNA-binding transcriptional MerR regulator
MKKKNVDIDLLSITEFAEFVGITAASLRHYDKIGVFSPTTRGSEFESKYRYYSPLQITTVKMIRVLTEIGVPLKTIKELTESRTPEKMLKVLRQHRDRLTSKINFLQEVYSVIDTFTDLLYEAISVMETEIIVSEMPEKRIILGDTTDFTGTTSFYREFLRFCKGQYEPKLNLSYPVGGYWDNMTEFLNEPSRPMRFFSLDPKGNEQKTAGLYLSGYTRGYYGQTNNLPKQMAAYAKRNGLVFNGPVYNIYLLDEISVIDPAQYLLQVSASVRETRRIISYRSCRRI